MEQIQITRGYLCAYDNTICQTWQQCLTQIVEYKINTEVVVIQRMLRERRSVTNGVPTEVGTIS